MGFAQTEHGKTSVSASLFILRTCVIWCKCVSLILRWCKCRRQLWFQTCHGQTWPKHANTTGTPKGPNVANHGTHLARFGCHFLPPACKDYTRTSKGPFCREPPANTSRSCVAPQAPGNFRRVGMHGTFRAVKACRLLCERHFQRPAFSENGCAKWRPIWREDARAWRAVERRLARSLTHAHVSEGGVLQLQGLRGRDWKSELLDFGTSNLCTCAGQAPADSKAWGSISTSMLNDKRHIGAHHGRPIA